MRTYLSCKLVNYLIFSAIIFIIINVISMPFVKSLSANLICSRIPGLTPPQRRICEESPEALVVISNGVKQGINECKRQFRNRRWNCSVKSGPNLFEHIMLIGSREASYTYSISSAGVTYTISQACSRGNISFCGCSHSDNNNESKSDTWKWSGCSTNIRYGIKLGKQFIDSKETEASVRSLMNLHNNNAGRKSVKDLLVSQCKCHGVSGSCTARTCWKTLPSFQTIGDHLMKKYNIAKRVIPHWGKNSGKIKRPRFLKLRKIASNKRKINLIPKQRDLVYFEKSHNYCDSNLLLDSMGTIGRHCNKTSTTTDSCDSMCCGRGYNTQQYLHTRKCQCKFHFCCFVNCNDCIEKMEIHICK